MEGYNMKQSIHTTLEPKHVHELKKYGHGQINDGIVKVLEIVKYKQYDTRKNLLMIADKILMDEEKLQNEQNE